jgi:hypothetical protein
MPVMPMITVIVLVVLLVGIGWLSYGLYKSENVGGLAILAGLFIGLFLWFAYLVWPPFPVVSVVLVVLAAAGASGLYMINAGVLPKGLAVAAASLVVLLLAWQGLLISWVNAEVVSELEVLNPGGTVGTALVVYHPGKSDFQKKASVAFAEGLVSNGWRVEITTASSQAPTDLSGYDLLVLGAPTYDWRPAKRIQQYVKGLGDLAGQRTITIISGLGYTELSGPAMEKLVREANGDLVKSLILWTAAPNEEMYGLSDAVEIMHRAAMEIPLPGG